ncbi:hypothetical protein [Okeania sp. KiyG1]|uniref:DUF6888 family protein n=1 Tax=Okeania sp. KiyG1 TaxID=2720165 RepID=UPI0035C90F5C
MVVGFRTSTQPTSNIICSAFGEKIIPTQAQLLQCYILSCWVTRFYLPINLKRSKAEKPGLYHIKSR